MYSLCAEDLAASAIFLLERMNEATGHPILQYSATPSHLKRSVPYITRLYQYLH